MLAPNSMSAGPSLLVLEFGLALVAAAAAVCCPRAGSRFFQRAERLFSKLARRRALSVFTVGAAAGLLRLAVLPLSPIPQPYVSDEFSYLLAAQTFASGRLTNPPHPMWVHFESFHIDFQPTYMSMYFPAQGLLLAAGKLFAGHAWYGVWISAALMCATICWMLQAWLPPGWALLGGFLAVLRIGLFSYWMDSYWGGALPALAGALVLGALPRLWRSFRARDFFWMALGMALLATSRPYEGLLVCLPVLAALCWSLGKKQRIGAIAAFVQNAETEPGRVSDPIMGQSSRFLNKRDSPRPSALLLRAAPALLLLLATLASLGYYNYRVFGNAFTPPYEVNREMYASAPHFVFQSPRPEPVYRHKVMRDFYAGLELRWFQDMQTPRGFIRKTGRKTGAAILFYFGAVLLIPLVMLPSVLRDRRICFLLITAFIFVAGLLVETWFIPHYAAPFTAGVYAILLQCMRHMRAGVRRGRLSGLFLVRAIPVVCVLLVTFRTFAGPLHIQLPDVKLLNPYGSAPAGLARARVEKQLESLPGGQLAIVRYSPDHDTYGEWVYNAADIDRSKVVWAREMDPADDADLLRYYKNHTAWLIQPDCNPPKLSPFAVPEKATEFAEAAAAAQGAHGHRY